jgi:hypothetical protein
MEANERELKMKLYQKIWAVMGAVNFVKKDGEVNFGESYKYATEAAIKKAVHAALVEHRLLFLPKKTDLIEQSAETVQDKYGKPKREFRSTVDLHYEFIDIDTGYGEPFSIHGAGSGSDEKSIYKAFTGAYKYAFHLSLSIPTGDDPEKEELSREEKKELKAAAHAEQQRIAEEKMAQIQAGTVPTSWDWRIALPRFEKLEQQYGKTEVSIALKMAGFNSLEETPSREAALTAYEKVRTTLAKAATEQPEWADKPHAKPESKLEKPTEALAAILERVAPSEPLNRKIAAIQNYKLYFRDLVGEQEANCIYYEILDSISGHIETKAPMIAKDPNKVRECITRLQHELERMQGEVVPA